MKTLKSIVVILFITSCYLFGEDNSEIAINTYYGISMLMITTGSGHGIGYTINGSITKGRKSLEVGLIYSNRESKIAGGDIKYRIFLGKIDRIQNDQKIFTAYLQYNLVYQKGMSYSPEIVKLGDITYLIESDPGRIATMGHYISYGNKIRIFRNTCLDASLGFGYYKGSLDKVNGPDTFGIHYQNSGFTYSFKIGLSYSFKE
jgi:hypothetical protein